MSCVFIEAGVSLWPSYGLAIEREDTSITESAFDVGELVYHVHVK